MALQTRSERTFQVFNTLFFVLLSFLFLYPFWYVLVFSFNDGGDAMKGGIFWWPRLFTMDNYRYIFASGEVMQAFGVSVARTVLGTALCILFTALISFAISRPELPGKRFFTIAFLIIMYFGGGLIPFYLMLHDINLLDKFWVYVIPGMFSVWNMIIMRTTFRNLPESLLEAAMIDGAGYYSAFFRIIIPLATPTLAALTLFTAVGHWNDWFTGAFFVNNNQLHPIQTYLQRMMNSVSMSSLKFDNGSQMSETAMKHAITPMSIRMAILVVVIVPIMCIYPFLQRYFVHGVMVGSLRE